MTGHVKALLDAFGFIKVDGRQDVFFHKVDLSPSSPYGFDQLQAGDRVSFELADTVRGPRARHVTWERPT